MNLVIEYLCSSRYITKLNLENGGKTPEKDQRRPRAGSYGKAMDNKNDKKVNLNSIL